MSSCSEGNHTVSLYTTTRVSCSSQLQGNNTFFVYKGNVCSLFTKKSQFPLYTYKGIQQFPFEREEYLPCLQGNCMFSVHKGIIQFPVHKGIVKLPAYRGINLIFELCSLFPRGLIQFPASVGTVRHLQGNHMVPHLKGKAYSSQFTRELHRSLFTKENIQFSVYNGNLAFPCSPETYIFPVNTGNYHKHLLWQLAKIGNSVNCHY